MLKENRFDTHLHLTRYCFSLFSIFYYVNKKTSLTLDLLQLHLCFKLSRYGSLVSN